MKKAPSSLNRKTRSLRANNDKGMYPTEVSKSTPEKSTAKALTRSNPLSSSLRRGQKRKEAMTATSVLDSSTTSPSLHSPDVVSRLASAQGGTNNYTLETSGTRDKSTSVNSRRSMAGIGLRQMLESAPNDVVLQDPLLASTIGNHLPSRNRLSSLILPPVTGAAQSEMQAKRQRVHTNPTAYGTQLEAANRLANMDALASQLLSLPGGVASPSVNPLQLSVPTPGQPSAGSLSFNDVNHLMSTGNSSLLSSEAQLERRTNEAQMLAAATQGPSLLSGDDIAALQLATRGGGSLLPGYLPMLSRDQVLAVAEANAYQELLSQAAASAAGGTMRIPSLTAAMTDLHPVQQLMLPSSPHHTITSAIASQDPRQNQATGQDSDVSQVLLREPNAGATGASNQKASSRSPKSLYLPSCDDDRLSDYQVLLRKQIEFFEADSDDVEVVVPGRRKGVVLGQVGVRCIHCAQLPVHRRSPGTAYFPSKLIGVYQAAQNLAKSHLCGHCSIIPNSTRLELVALRESGSTAGHGGKQYWADGARALGVCESDGVLRFA